MNKIIKDGLLISLIGNYFIGVEIQIRDTSRYFILYIQIIIFYFLYIFKNKWVKTHFSLKKEKRKKKFELNLGNKLD